MASKQRSKAVEDMQRKLAAEGYYTGPIDGITGPMYEQAVQRREKAADRAAAAVQSKVAEAQAKAAEAQARAAEASAKAAEKANSPISKIVGLGGQAAAVGAGALVGHKLADTVKKSMIASQISANRQIIKLGNQAEKYALGGIKNLTQARHGQALAAELKNIKLPKTVLAGAALSSFLAADAIYAHFVGREKAIKAGGDAAASAVDAFTATSALASTSTLAFTIKEAVTPRVQRATKSAAAVRAAGTLADDYIHDNRKVSRASNKATVRSGAKTGVAKSNEVSKLKNTLSKLGVDPKDVKGTGKGGRIVKADLEKALQMVGSKAGSNTSSPWRAGAKMAGKGAKAAGKLLGGKFVAPLVAFGAAGLTFSNAKAAGADTTTALKSGGKAGLKAADDLVTFGIGQAVVSEYQKAHSPEGIARSKLMNQRRQERILARARRASGKAYLNESARQKAKSTSPTSLQKPKGQTAAFSSNGSVSTTSYTTKDGRTVRVSSKQAESYRRRRK